MARDFPDHRDADLVLRLYELRREPVMRQSRDALNQKFLPKSFDEFAAVTKTEHPLNAAYRQVGSYWELAYGLIKHGVLNPDLAMESNGEGMILFAKAHPWLERIRTDLNPRAFLNAEWVATETETGKRVFAIHAARVKKQRG
ncbi:MAG: hypothetical protein WD771_09860 [Gemmatimonadaceae bacterium]